MLLQRFSSVFISSRMINRFIYKNIQPLSLGSFKCISNGTSMSQNSTQISSYFINSSLLHLQNTNIIFEPNRGYAKKRDKGSKAGKGKGSVVDITVEETSQVIDGELMVEEFDAVIEKLKDEYMKALAVRTNVGSIEELLVEMDGETYPLNEIAEVHRKSPQLVIINCGAFPQYTKNVMESITGSGMNLNPQQEGTKIAVPLPKITREHREGLSSKAKIMCNKCKDSIRQIHNNYSKKSKSQEGKVSDDLIFKVIQKIKEHQTNYVKDADKMLAAKQEELLKA